MYIIKYALKYLYILAMAQDIEQVEEVNPTSASLRIRKTQVYNYLNIQ